MNPVSAEELVALAKENGAVLALKAAPTTSLAGTMCRGASSRFASAPFLL